MKFTSLLFFLIIYFIYASNLLSQEEKTKVIFPDNSIIYDKELNFKCIIPNNKISSIVVSILSPSGFLIQQRVNKIYKGINKITLDTKNLKDGIYVLYLSVNYKTGYFITDSLFYYIIISHKNYKRLSKKEFILYLLNFIKISNFPDNRVKKQKDIYNFFKFQIFKLAQNKNIRHPVYLFLKSYLYYYIFKDFYNGLKSFYSGTKNLYKISKSDLIFKEWNSLKFSNLRNKLYYTINFYLINWAVVYGTKTKRFMDIINMSYFILPLIEKYKNEYNYSSDWTTRIILSKISIMAYKGIIELKKNNINTSKDILIKGINFFKTKEDFLQKNSYDSLAYNYYVRDKSFFYSWLAYIEYIKNNKKNMIFYLKQIKNNKYPVLNFIKGKIEFDKGNYSEAVKFLKKCLNDTSNLFLFKQNSVLSFYSEIQNSIGMCYYKMGYYQIALDKFLSAATSPDAVINYKENLAICYEKLSLSNKYFDIAKLDDSRYKLILFVEIINNIEHKIYIPVVFFIRKNNYSTNYEKLGKKKKAEKILKELNNIPDLFLKLYLHNITQKIKYKPLNNKNVVWVLPFDNAGGVYKRAGIGEYLQNITMYDIYKIKKFRIVERDKINDIIKEKKLSISRFGDKKYLKNKRKIITADYIITGNFAEFKNRYNLIISVISVDTGEIVKMSTFTGRKFNKINEYISKFVKML